MVINHCPVCGFKTDEKYPSIADIRLSYDICDCCGCEFGYDDNATYYDDWVKNGCEWFSPKSKPKDWCLEDQIHNQIRPWPPN